MSKLKINKDIEITKALPFKPFSKFGGLSLGFLKNVVVREVETNPEGKWEFAGYIIPRLEFEFIQFKEKDTEKDRFFTHGINPLQITLSSGEPREDAKILGSFENMWKEVKHIHNQFKTSPNYKELEVEPELDTGLPVEARLVEMKKFFTAIAIEFNTGIDKKNIYISTGGKDKLLVMKLIIDENILRFPGFVGRGFVEQAIIANGKLDTTLFFTHSETSNYDEAKSNRVASPAGGAPIDSDLPEEIRAALG